jgi:hypothetical protein
MHVIRHDHVASHRDAKLILCSGNVLLEASMDRFQICDLLSVNRADCHNEQRQIVGLEDLVEPGRAVFDH